MVDGILFPPNLADDTPLLKFLEHLRKSFGINVQLGSCSGNIFKTHHSILYCAV